MEDQKKQENKDVFATIKEHYARMSKSHKKIAAYVVQNYEKAPDMSAICIARDVTVSEATVVRFALSLGFEGYPEFRKALKNEINSKLTTVERIDMTLGEEEKEKLMQRSVFRVLKSDAECVEATLESLDYEVLRQCADIIRKARRVLVVGFRTTSILTDYLAHYLNLVLDDVRVINHSVTDIYEHLIKVSPEDVVIVMSFPRYAKKTYTTTKFLKDRGPKIIAISDSERAPINEFADYSLLAKSNVYSFIDSLAAPLSLINGLAVAVGFENIKETKQTFGELEEIWKEHYIYTGDDFVKDL